MMHRKIIAITWLLAAYVALAGSAHAQTEIPPGFFKFKKIYNPDRTYFKQLTDTEYDSINPGPVFLPFVLDRWPTGPITYEEFFSQKRPRCTTDASVKLQSWIYDNIKNPLERSHNVAYMAISRNRSGVQMLLKALANEPDPDVIADYLNTFAALSAKVPENVVKPRLTNASKRIRYQACRLYSIQSYADVKLLLKLAGGEADANVQAEFYRAAAANARKSTFAEWKPFLNLKDPVKLAEIIPGLLTFPEIRAHQKQVAEWARSAAPQVRFALVQNCHAKLDKELLQAVFVISATDKLSSVRAATATAIGRLKHGAALPQLLALGKDKLPGVRLQAAKSLKQFPVAKSFRLLIDLSGDGKSPLTRDAARQSLVTIAGKYPVDEQIGRYIDSKNEEIRHSTFLVLAAIKSNRYASKINARLKKEKRDLNQASAIRALIAAGASQMESTILSYAKSASTTTRTAVVEAIGALDLKRGYTIIETYSLEDRDKTTRKAAILSMGHIADNRFGKTLLTILKRTIYSSVENPEFLTTTDRAHACWSLSRLPKLDEKIIKRLKDQITKKVVITPMGPVPDQNVVRISACWVLATYGKRTKDPKVLGMARSMIAHLGGSSTDGGTSLGHYAKQAGLFLNDKPAPRRAMGISTFKFNLRPAKRIP